MSRQQASTRFTHVGPDSQELQTIADALSGAQKVAIAGAGISTAAGIPDFRSSGGLYAGGALFTEAAFFGSRRAQLLKTALRIRDLARLHTAGHVVSSPGSGCVRGESALADVHDVEGVPLLDLCLFRELVGDIVVDA
ncbi:hypothetical protein HD806DRAFT_532210 [Xylariaceae sp. AK1471]|nr:hypothetical protein HD806DRAFT_532210 [Xylariaceae sp. AK1471]